MRRPDRLASAIVLGPLMLLCEPATSAPTQPRQLHAQQPSHEEEEAVDLDALEENSEEEAVDLDALQDTQHHGGSQGRTAPESFTPVASVPEVQRQPLLMLVALGVVAPVLVMLRRPKGRARPQRERSARRSRRPPGDRARAA